MSSDIHLRVITERPRLITETPPKIHPQNINWRLITETAPNTRPQTYTGVSLQTPHQRYVLRHTLASYYRNPTKDTSSDIHWRLITETPLLITDTPPKIHPQNIHWRLITETPRLIREIHVSLQNSNQGYVLKTFTGVSLQKPTSHCRNPRLLKPTSHYRNPRLITENPPSHYRKPHVSL